MKITAGLSGVDAYDASCDAGADELFCGYVPEVWASRYGLALPMNRREVRWCNVQIGSRSELQLLADKVACRGVPVALTFNSLSYAPEQYPLLGETILQCADDGFRDFIVADPALLVWLHEQGISRRVALHISGELGEMNRLVLRRCRALDARRIIFHRKVTLTDMEHMIAHDRTEHPDTPLTFEAFALNELCHFHGGFCQSLHCDELPHLCRVPSQLGGIASAMASPVPIASGASFDGVGASGCGLCALWRMQQIGVTHLKLVGRGNLPEETIRDIAALHTAVQLVQGVPDEAAYLAALRRALFPQGCGRRCYYPNETDTLLTVGRGPI